MDDAGRSATRFHARRAQGMGHTYKGMLQEGEAVTVAAHALDDEEKAVLPFELSAFVHTQCKSPDPIGTRKLNHCRPC